MGLEATVEVIVVAAESKVVAVEEVVAVVEDGAVVEAEAVVEADMILTELEVRSINNVLCKCLLTV